MLSRTPHLVTLSPDAKGLALCAAKKIKPPFTKGMAGAFLSALSEEDGAQPVVIDQPDAIQTQVI